MAPAQQPDPAVLAAIHRYGSSALAWEVLRRNPDYRTAFGDLTTLPEHGRAADVSFAARWGLHFP